MDAGPPTDAPLDVSRLAKAEFHLHLEATLSWEVARRFNGCAAATAPWLSAADPFPTFKEFTAPWHAYLLPALRQPGVYAQWLAAAARWLASVGVRYAEVNTSGSLIEKLGLPVRETLQSVCRELDRARAETGVTLRLFAAVRRDTSPELNAQWVERWLEYAAGHLTGLDLHGYELDGPTAVQKPSFDIGRAAGLRLRAHAGEHGTARDVAEAIDVLGVSSINHGTRAADDPGLLRELAARRIVLHLCPTSNVLLHVVPSYREFPLRRFLEAGVPVTLNSDDPVIFGTDLNREFREMGAHLGLTQAEARGLLRTGWACAVVDEETRRARLAEL
ncbi:MAG: hypothetical protein HYZ53_02880 [Planctomycetes bacterium]|nr:hypothetical protein [Planctomycetota bacterium]